MVKIGHSGAVEGRPINDLERALVSGILASEGDGFEALRAQLPTARVVPGCKCGCGTIDFVYDDDAVDLPRSTAANPVDPSPSVTDESGAVVGSLILFLKDGLLSSLEIASWSDPLPLPRFDHVVWDGSE